MNRFFDIAGDISRQLSPWELARRGFPVDVARYQLLDRLRLRSDIAGGVLVVEPLTISDLASIPRILWAWMNPSDPRIALGAWFHDDAYRNKGQLFLEDGERVTLTRKDCDAILAYEAMPTLHAPRSKQHAVYHALRTFGDRWT